MTLRPTQKQRLWFQLPLAQNLLTIPELLVLLRVGCYPGHYYSFNQIYLLKHLVHKESSCLEAE